MWFVDLAPLADPELVAGAAAEALGLRLDPAIPPAMSVARLLAGKALLLVLDNCERVAAAAAELVDEVLAGGSAPRVLATSREPLRISGERLVRVPPLGLPDQSQDAEGVYATESACLFAERARLSAPTYALGAGEAMPVAAICRWLEGIPLAIELAAARLSFLSVEQVEARLSDRFRLLRGEVPTIESRHRSMHTVLEWSYGMLGEHERSLFRRLAVFRGGWTLEAAESVCGSNGSDADGLSADDGATGTARGGVTPSDVLDVLGRLVARSLVVVERCGTANRYRFLETVREYADERLDSSIERVRLAARHTRWYEELLENAAAGANDPSAREWLARIDADHDNCRAALAWAVDDAHDPDLGLRLVRSLAWYWYSRGHQSEGRRWTEALLHFTVGPEVRSHLLFIAGRLAESQGEFQAAARAFEDRIGIEREREDASAVAVTLMHLAWPNSRSGMSSAPRCSARKRWRHTGSSARIAISLLASSA